LESAPAFRSQSSAWLRNLAGVVCNVGAVSGSAPMQTMQMKSFFLQGVQLVGCPVEQAEVRAGRSR
jgi:hypothetical protein